MSNYKIIDGMKNLKKINNIKYDIVIIALAHKEFEKIKIKIPSKI